MLRNCQRRKRSLSRQVSAEFLIHCGIHSLVIRSGIYTFASIVILTDAHDALKKRLFADFAHSVCSKWPLQALEPKEIDVHEIVSDVRNA